MLLHADDSFPSRMREFESRFGRTDDDTLAVLAQAAYHCWGNCHYRGDLLQLCAAIGTGKPTLMYLHNQVDTRRWIELNSYVVGVQHWLNAGDVQVPDVVAREKIDLIGHWLGEHSPTKEVLGSVFLSELIDNLVCMNLTRLGTAGSGECEEYYDFGRWYKRPDGTFYSRARERFIDQCTQQLAPESRPDENAIAEILRNLLRERPHSCMHRFARHLDIQLTSIGVLNWRGNLPPDTVPKEAWTRFIDAGCGLQSWLDGAAPANDYATRAHSALGQPDDRKRAMVVDFLRAQDRGSAYSGDWIDEQSRARGRKAYQVLGVDYAEQ